MTRSRARTLRAFVGLIMAGSVVSHAQAQPPESGERARLRLAQASPGTSQLSAGGGAAPAGAAITTSALPAAPPPMPVPAPVVGPAAGKIVVPPIRRVQPVTPPLPFVAAPKAKKAVPKAGKTAAARKPAPAAKSRLVKSAGK